MVSTVCIFPTEPKQAARSIFRTLGVHLAGHLLVVGQDSLAALAQIQSNKTPPKCYFLKVKCKDREK